MAPRRPAPEECPVCGERVPRGSPACPHCGADERAGWNEEASVYDGLDLPDDDLGSAGRERNGPAWYWVLAAVVLAAAVTAAALNAW